MIDPHAIRPQIELAAGGALLSSPFWVRVLSDVQFYASVIAAVCGAIIGVHAVWRLLRRRQGKVS